MSLFLDDMFKVVVFDGDERQYYYDLSIKVKTLAENIDANCPDSADKTLAFRALHLALMHVENALSKKDKYK